jgi:hypothetical protein
MMRMFTGIEKRKKTAVSIITITTAITSVRGFFRLSLFFFSLSMHFDIVVETG